MSKCCTVGCKAQAGNHVLQWEDYSDEPVCDECAAYYTALGATDFTVTDRRTHPHRASDGAFEVIPR